MHRIPALVATFFDKRDEELGNLGHMVAFGVGFIDQAIQDDVTGPAATIAYDHIDSAVDRGLTVPHVRIEVEENVNSMISAKSRSTTAFDGCLARRNYFYLRRASC